MLKLDMNYFIKDYSTFYSHIKYFKYIVRAEIQVRTLKYN